MLICLGHVESLNWGNVFKNWWDLCSHNPGDPFRVGEGGWLSTALRSHLKYTWDSRARTFGKLETQRDNTRGDSSSGFRCH